MLDYAFTPYRWKVRAEPHQPRIGDLDHKAVWAQLQIQSFSLQPAAFLRTLRNWQPHTANTALLIFMHRLLRGRHGGWNTTMRMQAFSGCFSKHCTRDRHRVHSSRASLPSSRDSSPFCGSTGGTCLASDSKNTRDMRRQLRRWDAERRVLTADLPSRLRTSYLQCSGQMTANRELWRQELQRPFVDKYGQMPERSLVFLMLSRWFWWMLFANSVLLWE